MFTYAFSRVAVLSIAEAADEQRASEDLEYEKNRIANEKKARTEAMKYTADEEIAAHANSTKTPIPGMTYDAERLARMRAQNEAQKKAIDDIEKTAAERVRARKSSRASNDTDNATRNEDTVVLECTFDGTDDRQKIAAKHAEKKRLAE